MRSSTPASSPPRTLRDARAGGSDGRTEHRDVIWDGRTAGCGRPLDGPEKTYVAATAAYRRYAAREDVVGLAFATIAHADADVGSGTTVAARRQLSRPALLAGGSHSTGPRASAAEPLSVDVEGGSSPVVRLTGSVDQGAARELSEQLLSACRGGIHPLTIDLSGVTLLPSSGLRVLYDVRDRLAAHRQPLHLDAPPGCPADTVLRMVGLTRT